jgi:IrrE N-terminal-like domain
VRRGFQAAAERLAAEVCQELGLEADDCFDPRRLADEYGIPTVALTELSGDGADPKAIRHLTIVDDGCFSAPTAFTGSARFIVYNPTHSDCRLANSLAHELAHVLLEHEPGPLLGRTGGCRTSDREVEAEADTLAGMLLVSRQAALANARAGLPYAWVLPGSG